MPLSPELLQLLNQNQVWMRDTINCTINQFCTNIRFILECEQASGQHSALAGVLQSQQHQQILNNNALAFGPLNPCTTGLVFDFSNITSQTLPVNPSVAPFGDNIIPSNIISQPIDQFSSPPTPTTPDHSASTLEHTQPAQELPPSAAASPLPLGRRFSNVSSCTEDNVEDTESHPSNEQLPKTLFEVKQEIDEHHTIQPAIICRTVVSNVHAVSLLTPKEERPNIQRIISERVDTISFSPENASNVPIVANTATFSIKSELQIDDNESLEENSEHCDCGNCGNRDPQDVEMPSEEIEHVRNHLNMEQGEQREVETVVELSPIEPNSNQDFFVEPEIVSEMNQSVSAPETSLKRPNEEVVENTEGNGGIGETTAGDAKRPRIERELIAIDPTSILQTSILQNISENSAFERVIPSSPRVNRPPSGEVEVNLQSIEIEGNIGSLCDQSKTSETTASNCIPTSTITSADTPHSPLIQSKLVNNPISTNTQTPKSSSTEKANSLIGESDQSQSASESQSESPKKTVIATDITTTITSVTVLNTVLDSPVIQANSVVDLVSVPVPKTVQEPTNVQKPKLGTFKKPSTDSTVPTPETKKSRSRSSVNRESANADSSKVKSVSQPKGKPSCESLPKKQLQLEEEGNASSAAITSPLPRAQPTNTLHHASESSKVATAESQSKKAPERVTFDTNCDKRPEKAKTTQQTAMSQTKESKLKPTSTPKAASKGKTSEKESLTPSSSKSSSKSKPALNQSASQRMEVTSKSSSTRNVSKSPTRTDKVLPNSNCSGDEWCSSRAQTKTRPSVSADGESDTWHSQGDFRILKMKCYQEECRHFFTSKSKHERHMLVAHNRLPIICPLSGCQASFKSKESWINHVDVQHKDTQHWICRYANSNSICRGRHFANDRALYGHAYMCHEEGEFECVLCPFKDKYRTTVINHHTKRHKAPRIPVFVLHCTLEKCLFTASSQIEIDRHLQSEHAIGKYFCLIADCHYNSYSYSDLQKHLDSGHQVPYVCGSGKCKEKFRQYIELEDHHFDEHQKGSFGCLFKGCPFEGPTRASVNRHADTAPHLGNRNVNISKGKPKKFNIVKVHCDSCGDLFSTEQDLEEHNLGEHQIQRYACVALHCEKSFKEIEDIDRHVKEAHGHIKSWRCFHCCPDRPTFHATHNELRNHRFFWHDGGDFRCNAAECTFKGSTRKGVIQHYNSKHWNANQTPPTPMTATETHNATNAASYPNGDIDYRHYDRLPNQYTQQTEDITEYTPELPPLMPSLQLPLPPSAFIPNRTDSRQPAPFQRDPAPPHNANFYQNTYSRRY